MKAYLFSLYAVVVVALFSLGLKLTDIDSKLKNLEHRQMRLDGDIGTERLMRGLEDRALLLRVEAGDAASKLDADALAAYLNVRLGRVPEKYKPAHTDVIALKGVTDEYFTLPPNYEWPVITNYFNVTNIITSSFVYVTAEGF